jgi:transposase
MSRPVDSLAEEPTWPTVHPHAAGLDIGSEAIWVAVPADRDPETVRSFGTYTPDLYALADWLQRCRIDTVAMESTGVYWIPIFEILEARGFEAQVVNAHHLKQVPGRKSDVQDCQWIQRLHAFGLLNGSFRPEEELRVLRAYLRHRTTLIDYRAAHIQHMQKALQQMNLQLTQAVKDVTGQTGLAMIRAILAGERNPEELAALRDGRCAKTEPEFVKALTGNYREEHLFALKQAVELYDFYTAQLRACDAEIERQFSALQPERVEPLPPLERGAKGARKSKNAPAYDARELLYQVVGVDLVAISGLNESTVQTILTEVGLDLSAFPSEKHFCSWLGLAPHNDISGGKVLRRHTLKNHNRAGQAFRMAAESVSRKRDGLGAYYRRMRARLGPQKAIVATAHKLARIFYHMLKDRTPFRLESADQYEERVRARELAQLKKKAAKLGYTVVSAAA